MKLSKLASAMPFAHFLGMPSAAAARAEEDDDRKQRDGESDDDYAKRMEEKDKDEEAARKAEEEKEKENARRAEEGDDDADAEADDKDDKEEGKRAGRAGAARQRERVRCAAIVAEGIKLGSVKQACSLAFDTNMTAAQAVGVLSAAAADRVDGAGSAAAAAPSPRRGPSIDERMAKVVTPNPGASAPAAAAPSLAEQILAAGKLRRGEA
jgi:phage/plasmid-associated DNA primase